MKKLLYVPTNINTLYIQLVSIREANQRARVEGSISLTRFTKEHEKQIKAIEKLDNFLNPNYKIKPAHPVLDV